MTTIATTKASTPVEVIDEADPLLEELVTWDVVTEEEDWAEEEALDWLELAELVVVVGAAFPVSK